MSKNIDLTAYELLELLYPDEEPPRVLEKPEDRIHWSGKDSEEQILGRIFSKTYAGGGGNSAQGSETPAGRKKYGRSGKRRIEAGTEKEAETLDHRKTLVLVDGYNMIFAWDETAKLAAAGEIERARERLLERLLVYKTMRGVELRVVFDAYLVQGGMGSEDDFHGVSVVYTKGGETADQYIERESSDKALNREFKLKVATSDSIEQLIAYAHGANRISARELEMETRAAEDELRALREATHVRRGMATLGEQLTEGLNLK